MDILDKLKKAKVKASGSFSVRLGDNGGFDAVLVNLVPTGDGGGILLGANGSDTVMIGHPELAAGQHTVQLKEGDARTSVRGISYVAESGQVEMDVNSPLTSAKGEYRFKTKDGIEVSGEFNINAVVIA
ncbi:hypothetical protein GXB78_14315 [Pseudomonas moraviensis subsp. stanleyae]|uniref:hypothetical protein n=1 Tax=Pseudomonas moraviensis TaxID=321662 RepID=UPI002E378820|nr:hypothetical protein [Pseudomonas moraviensis]MED7668372.1 hypothetical protein [Pseudomonas moraviensis subsp. stanleyae]